MQILRFATIVAILSLPGIALGEPGKNDFGVTTTNGKGPKLGAPQTERWRVGVVVAAGAGVVSNVVSDVQLPVEWPEQQVKVVEEDITPFARSLDYRMVDTVKEFVLTIPQVPAGQEAKALITFEITRYPMSPPDDVTILKKPESRKLPKYLRRYLGPSPRIESQSGKIKAAGQKADEGERGQKRLGAGPGDLPVGPRSRQAGRRRETARRCKHCATRPATMKV